MAICELRRKKKKKKTFWNWNKGQICMRKNPERSCSAKNLPTVSMAKMETGTLFFWWCFCKHGDEQNLCCQRHNCIFNANLRLCKIADLFVSSVFCLLKQNFLKNQPSIEHTLQIFTHILFWKVWGSPMTWNDQWWHKTICTGCLLSHLNKCQLAKYLDNNCSLKGVK